MAEVLPEKILGKLGGFSPLQRVLLATAGTLQSTLSAYFQKPVTVRVREQTLVDSYEMTRVVDLVCDGEAVCSAWSTIITVDASIRGAIRERGLGLGQILMIKGLAPSFDLLETGQDEKEFYRVYRLEAPGVTYRIKEVFRKELYP